MYSCTHELVNLPSSRTECCSILIDLWWHIYRHMNAFMKTMKIKECIRITYVGWEVL